MYSPEWPHPTSENAESVGLVTGVAFRCCSRFGGPLLPEGSQAEVDEAAQRRHDCVYVFRPHAATAQTVAAEGSTITEGLPPDSKRMRASRVGSHDHPARAAVPSGCEE